MTTLSLGPDYLAAERLVSAAYEDDVALYEALYRAARTLVPVDAFYLCRIDQETKWLHFVYNCEGEHFDKPEPFPFGDGPTSRVARTGFPVVWGSPEEREGLAVLPFADPKTRSGSAIHWPLWADVPHDGPPDGVISVQAYASGAYSETHLAAIEWFAIRTSDALRRRTRDAAQKEVVESAALAASRRRAVEDVRRFVALLDDLALLRNDPTRLLSAIRRRQVELTGWAPNSPLAKDELYESLMRLSHRELEVLLYVAQGMSNEEVGEALMCSRHTVKSHLDKVYRETPLKNRTEIAAAAATIRTTRSGG